MIIVDEQKIKVCFSGSHTAGGRPRSGSQAAIYHSAPAFCTIGGHITHAHCAVCPLGVVNGMMQIGWNSAPEMPRWLCAVANEQSAHVVFFQAALVFINARTLTLNSRLYILNFQLCPPLA
jgi:hypothetical protein